MWRLDRCTFLEPRTDGRENDTSLPAPYVTIAGPQSHVPQFPMLSPRLFLIGVVVSVVTCELAAIGVTRILVTWVFR